MSSALELPEQVLSALVRQGANVSVAESCTGGGLGQALASLSGVSRVYRGGVVAYHNDVKTEVLGVSPALLRAVGAVSREVALAMAHGARALLRSDYAVSVTGIAGPTGGTPDKPVGTVMFAVVGPGVAKAWGCRFSGDRQRIQQQSVREALRGLLEMVEESSTKND